MRGMKLNTIEKITVRKNKVLKLNTVLIREIKDTEFMDLDKISYTMESYIKSKGNSIIGPMINYTTSKANENGQIDIIIKLMVQLKTPIHNVETPYEFKNQIRVTNCLFARFNEKEENLQFGYSKLQLYAFENNIKLKGDSYTIYVDNKEGNLVSDIFMEVDKGGLIGEGL